MVGPGLALHPGHQEEECERHRQGPLEEVRQELLHQVGGSEVGDTGEPVLGSNQQSPQLACRHPPNPTCFLMTCVLSIVLDNSIRFFAKLLNK